MIRDLKRTVLFLVAWLAILSVSAWPQSNLDKLKSEYQSITAQLRKHVSDRWIDDAPESPGLLARQWSLAGEWVAAWLNAHPSADADEIVAALRALDPEREPEYLKLDASAFLVVAPTAIGNVFIVGKIDGEYRLAWSTAQVQQARGKQAEVLAAWRPENARSGGRGPYWAASGSAGSVIPRLGILPSDAQGHARFYINGIYAQSAGGTEGAQTSVWLWEGRSARPLIAKDYTIMADQDVGTRVEGDLLKVQQKQSFRTFFSCGMCEERQMDWTIRLTPRGIEDLGERSLLPELDAVDALFYRVIHQRPAADVAAPAVVRYAEKVVREVRRDAGKQWKKLPSLGMMGSWSVHGDANKKVLCFGTDGMDASLFTLKASGSKFFISDVKPADQPCQK